MYFRLLFAASLFCFCHEVSGIESVKSPELIDIRKRWSVQEVIRNLGHIKEDVQKIAKMQQSGVISNDEALFYYVRMHDFDGNDKLDGLELLTALTHTLGDNPQYDMVFEEREQFVDKFLQYDQNSDGYVSYRELKNAE